MSESLPDKREWIEAYVERAHSAGFDCTATDDGCHYAEDEFGVETTLVCRPCHCGCNSWGMRLK